MLVLGNAVIHINGRDSKSLGCSAVERRRLVIIAAVVVVIALAIAVDVSFSPGPPPRPSSNVYFDPFQSSCKGGATFSCTIVLDAKQGTLTAAAVASVQINGTNTQPTVTLKGNQLVISASLQSIQMQRGLADVGPSLRPPTIGQIVVNLSDGTTVSGLIGPGGVL